MGVQEGNGELYLPGAPGFHGGSVYQRVGEEEKEEEMIRAKTIRKRKGGQGAHRQWLIRKIRVAA